LEAVRNIKMVALAIGEEDARIKLIPLIDEYCFPDENGGNQKQSQDRTLGPKEDILREVALIMNGTVVPLVGGPDNLLPVFMLLQKLCMVNEGLVREAAINSIILCAKEMDYQHVEENIFPMMKLLANGTEWTTRISAANAAPRLYCYLRSEDIKKTCQDLIYTLIKDVNPLVRYDTYFCVKHMVRSIADDNPAELLEFITPILQSVREESQDHFRFNIIGILISLLKVKCKECKEIVVLCKEYLFLLCEDNWSVRRNLLLQMMDIIDADGTWTIVDDILPFFVSALTDTEPSIRLVALELVPKYISLWNITTEKVKEFMTRDLIKLLLEDEKLVVREAASGVIMDMLWKIHGTDKEFKELVVDTMDKMYHDESEVRVNFCNSLYKAFELCGEEYFVNYLLPFVPKIQEDEKWRIRAGILQHIKIFVSFYKEEKITEKELLLILETAFRDPVAAVREEGVNHISELVDTLGPKWVISSFLKMIEQFRCEEAKCCLRLVPIRIGKQLAMLKADDKCPGLHELQKAAVTMVSKGSGDSISNVRLACGDALTSIINSAGLCDCETEIRKALEILKKDQDREIQDLGIEGLSLLDRVC